MKIMETIHYKPLVRILRMEELEAKEKERRILVMVP